MDRFTSSQVTEIRGIDYLLRQIASDLRYVDGATARKLPWSLVRPLEDLVSHLIPNHSLLLYPRWDWNYAILAQDLINIYHEALDPILTADPDKMSTIFKDCPKSLYPVSFPSVDRLSILQHSLLGHEVGHRYAARFLEDFDRERKAYSWILREFVIASGGDPDDPAVRQAHERNRVFEFILRIRQRGLEELISDIAGVILFGPAAVLSLLYFSQRYNLDDLPTFENKYYPPWRMRLREALKTLHAAGLYPPLDTGESPFPELSVDFREKLRRHIEYISAVTGKRSDLRELLRRRDYRTAYKLGYKSIFRRLPLVRQQLLQETKPYRDDPNTFWNRMDYLVARLHQHVPPNADEREANTASPVSMVQIINAGWLYRLISLSRPFTKAGNWSTDFRLRTDSLNRLVLRGIELNYVQKLFNQLKRGGRS